MGISNRYRTFETIEATLENGSEKRISLYPIRGSFFFSIVMCLTSTIIVLFKVTNGMTFNPTTTLKLIFLCIYRQSSVPFQKCQISKITNYISPFKEYFQFLNML
jgi:hypothetical protein